MPVLNIKRRGTNHRLATAARVLRRFDLPQLMLAAQTTDTQAVRTFITTSLQAGRLVGPAVHRRRKIEDFVWTVTSKGMPA